ncbi:MAG: DNA polymerase III subunit delta [Thermodesulfobacteriota bacterium]
MNQKKSSKSGYDEFINNVTNGDINSVYIFTGDQSHLIDKALSALKTKVLGAQEDMNYIIFHGEAASGEEILENASTMPMFSSKKIVVVRNADKLKAKELTVLEPYFESPSPSSSLVLIFSDGKAPKIKSKKVKKFNFSVSKDNTASLLRDEAQKLGLTISPRATQALISLVGDDLKELHNELVKLSLYRSEGKTVETEDIEKHTRRAQFGDVFTLINAISKKNKKAAQKALLDLEAQGEEPLSVLSRLIWRFRLIWKAKELTDNKTPKADLLKELKMSPGAFYYLSQDLKKYSYQDISRIMELLLECDKKLKISYVPRNFHLTKLMTELCSQSK